MMSQTHLGYTYWNQPPRNTMPRGDRGAGAARGRDGRGGGGQRGRLAGARREPPRAAGARCVRARAALPRGLQSRRGAVRNSRSRRASRGSRSSSRIGHRDARRRASRSARAGTRFRPASTSATLTVSGPDDRKVTVARCRCKARRGAAPVGRGLRRDARRRLDRGRALRERAAPPQAAVAAHPGPRPHALGRDATAGGCVARAACADGMRLEYAMHLFTAGKVKVHATLAPTQKFQPGPGLRFAISFDDEPPQVVNVHADESRAYWSKYGLRRRRGLRDRAHARSRRAPTRSSSGRSIPGSCCRSS